MRYLIPALVLLGVACSSVPLEVRNRPFEYPAGVTVSSTPEALAGALACTTPMVEAEGGYVCPSRYLLDRQGQVLAAYREDQLAALALTWEYTPDEENLGLHLAHYHDLAVGLAEKYGPGSVVLVEDTTTRRRSLVEFDSQAGILINWDAGPRRLSLAYYGLYRSSSSLAGAL